MATDSYFPLPILNLDNETSFEVLTRKIKFVPLCRFWHRPYSWLKQSFRNTKLFFLDSNKPLTHMYLLLPNYLTKTVCPIPGTLRKISNNLSDLASTLQLPARWVIILLNKRWQAVISAWDWVYCQSVQVQ